jgi:hypothetical protein
MKRFLNFIKVCHDEFYERTTFFHKFCSFWSCGLRESSRVHYTADFEEERLREKSFCMFEINITSPWPYNTERRNFVSRNKNLKFISLIEVCHNDWMNERRTFFISFFFFCSFWSCVLRETSIRVDYTDFEEEERLREKREMFSN